MWGPSGSLLEILTPSESLSYTNVTLSFDRELVITDRGSLSNASEDLDSGGKVLAVSGWSTQGLPLHPFRGR